MSVPSPARDPNHAGLYDLGLLGVALPHPHASAGCVGIHSTPMMAYTAVQQLGPRKRVSFSAQSGITLIMSAPSTPSASSSTLHLAAVTSSDPPFSLPEQAALSSASSFFDISAAGPIPTSATADLTLRRTTSSGETAISPTGSSGRGFCHRGSLFQAAIDERRRKSPLGLPAFLGGSAVSGGVDDGTTRYCRSGVRRRKRSQNIGDSGEGGSSVVS